MGLPLKMDVFFFSENPLELMIIRATPMTLESLKGVKRYQCFHMVFTVRGPAESSRHEP